MDGGLGPGKSQPSKISHIYLKDIQKVSENFLPPLLHSMAFHVSHSTVGLGHLPSPAVTCAGMCLKLAFWGLTPCVKAGHSGSGGPAYLPSCPFCSKKCCSHLLGRNFSGNILVREPCWEMRHALQIMNALTSPTKLGAPQFSKKWTISRRFSKDISCFESRNGFLLLINLCGRPGGLQCL